MENKINLLSGTYTSGKSKGIYVYNFDVSTGDAEYLSMVEVENSSYLVVSKNRKFVYAVSENEEDPSFANAFQWDEQRKELIRLNKQETQGSSPCFINVDSNGKHVVTANYGGSITVFDTKEDGSLGFVSQYIEFKGEGSEHERQDAPHIHCVKFSPDEKYLFATDLGNDTIYRFDVDINSPRNFLIQGTREEFYVPKGSGPRHLEFHPSGKYLYLINELAGTVVGFNYNGGSLEEIQIIQADILEAEGSGDLSITPDGNFLYASNRLKNDGVAIFSINQEDGVLTKVDYQNTGIHPRNMIVSPDGKFLLVANRDSNLIEIFEIEKETGLLTKIEKDIELDMPVCLQFI